MQFFLHKIKIAAPAALHETKGVFSFAKENTPFGTPRERLRLVVSGLRKSFAFGMGMPARGGAAFSVAIPICLCSYYPLLRSRWQLCCLTDVQSAGRAALQAPDLQCRGSRGTPLVLSLGGVRGIFSFRKREYPPLPRPHTLWGQKQPPALPSILLIVVPISPTKNKRLRAGHKTQHLPDDWLLEH